MAKDEGKSNTAGETALAMQNAKPGAGHNIEQTHGAIIAYFKERVAVDVERRKLTKRMAKARGILKDMSLDTQAIDREYGYFKMKKHDQDGYDDAVTLTHEVLNKADTGDLFAPLYDVENL